MTNLCGTKWRQIFEFRPMRLFCAPTAVLRQFGRDILGKIHVFRLHKNILKEQKSWQKTLLIENNQSKIQTKTCARDVVLCFIFELGRNPTFIEFVGFWIVIVKCGAWCCERGANSRLSKYFVLLRLLIIRRCNTMEQTIACFWQ